MLLQIIGLISAFNVTTIPFKLSEIASRNVTNVDAKFSEITLSNKTAISGNFSEITSSNKITISGNFSEILSRHATSASGNFLEIALNKSTFSPKPFTTLPNVSITSITAIDESSLVVVLDVANDTSQGIILYTVECIDTLFILERDTLSLNVSAKVFIFKDLSSNKIYFFRARAHNLVGPGPWSPKAFGKTKKADVYLYGPVQKFSFKPIQYKESTSLAIYWKAPLNAEKNKVYYRVLLCSLNIPCDNFSSKKMKTSTSFGGLIPDFLYQGTIVVFNQNDEANISLSSSFAYKTFSKDTCPAQYFACRYSSGCILLNLCCNNIIDCVDGSDEQVEADCHLPPDVKGLKIKNKGENSITIQFDAIEQPQERVLSYEVDNINNDVQTLFQELKAYYPPIRVSFNNLLLGTFYSFRVRSRNLSGYSKWSILLNVTTTGVAATMASVTSRAKHGEPTQPMLTTSTSVIGYVNFTSNISGIFHQEKFVRFSGRKIGVIIGIILVVGLLVVGFVWFYKRKTFHRKRILNNDDLYLY